MIIWEVCDYPKSFPFDPDSDVIGVACASFGEVVDCIDVDSGRGITLGACLVIRVLRKVRDQKMEAASTRTAHSPMPGVDISQLLKKRS